MAVRACRPFSPSTSIEQLTGRVGDTRLLTELGRAGHEDQHLHDPHPVQTANRIRGDSERVEHGLTRQPAGGLQVDVSTHDALAQQLAVLVRQLPCHVDTGIDRPVVQILRALRRRREGPGRGPGAAPSPNRSQYESRSSGLRLLISCHRGRGGGEDAQRMGLEVRRRPRSHARSRPRPDHRSPRVSIVDHGRRSRRLRLRARNPGRGGLTRARPACPGSPVWARSADWKCWANSRRNASVSPSSATAASLSCSTARACRSL